MHPIMGKGRVSETYICLKNSGLYIFVTLGMGPNFDRIYFMAALIIWEFVFISRKLLKSIIQVHIWVTGCRKGFLSNERTKSAAMLSFVWFYFTWKTISEKFLYFLLYLGELNFCWCPLETVKGVNNILSFWFGFCFFGNII